ncbi:unnamed protein product [Protopolystoma xenopodis]|uniref:Uncharacterized protein n=1 Tax=Protopolystoma xenopodis TaxID=117903 RepID=A0A448XN38_9PLAT|nr:unnamed protein product [Protopolystoma xenopodis]
MKWTRDGGEGVNDGRVRGHGESGWLFRPSCPPAGFTAHSSLGSHFMRIVPQTGRLFGTTFSSVNGFFCGAPCALVPGSPSEAEPEGRYGRHTHKWLSVRLHKYRLRPSLGGRFSSSPDLESTPNASQKWRRMCVFRLSTSRLRVPTDVESSFEGFPRIPALSYTLSCFFISDIYHTRMKEKMCFIATFTQPSNSHGTPCLLKLSTRCL